MGDQLVADTIMYGVLPEELAIAKELLTNETFAAES